MSCSPWKGNSLNQMGQRQATWHSPSSRGRAGCQRKGTETWASGVLRTTGTSVPKSHLSHLLSFSPTTPHTSKVTATGRQLMSSEARSAHLIHSSPAFTRTGPYLWPWTSLARCSTCSSSWRKQSQHLSTSFFTGTTSRVDIRRTDA